MSDLKRSILASIFLTAIGWPKLASADYIDSVNGELSGNFQNPTSIALVSSSSTLALFPAAPYAVAATM